MDKHESIRRQLASLALGELPERERSEVRAHVDRCDRCRAELRQFEQLLNCAGRRSDLSANESLHESARDRLFTSIRSENETETMARPHRRWALLGRRIMRSRMTKLAAAVILVAAVILGVRSFDGTPVKAVEFSEIAKALGEVPWMHTSALADTPHAKGTIELWIGFDAKVQGDRMPDGKVTFRRLEEHEKAEYDPNSNTITLSYAHEDELSRQTSSPAVIVESMQKALKDHGAEIVARMGEHQGRKVQVQEISLANHFNGIALYTVKLYVDPQSKLLCAMESAAFDANNIAISSGKATYDYLSTGPRDIYDLGVPRDARIVNKMPASDSRSILERYRQIREDATKEYIAVIAHNTDVAGTDVINMLDIDYKSGRKHRWERHSVFDEGTAFRDSNDPAWAISKQRIGETFESMLAWSQGQITKPGKTWISVHLYDGEYSGSVRRDPKDGWGTSRVRYDPDSSGPPDALGDLAWPEILPGAQRIEDAYAAEHKLICFERRQQGRLYNGTVSLPGRFLYYLDPACDYLCRRQVIEWRPDAEWQEDKDWLQGVDPTQMRDGSIIVEDITETFQAPNGHWYPRSIMERQTGIRKDYRQAPIKDNWSKRIYLDLSPEFPEGVFDTNKLPGQ
jgi:hypothetical protein